MKEEIWKDIPSYEGYYQVSNTGRVKSLPRTVITNNGFQRRCRGYVLAQSKTHKGYMLVALQRASTSTSISVHRLVAQSFIANPKNLPCVNHKDENKSNNQVSNLEWCNNRYNINYGTTRQRISKAHKELLKGRSVIQLTRDVVVVNYFPNAATAMRQTGIDASAITKVCLNRPKFKTAGGYIWRYAD